MPGRRLPGLVMATLFERDRRVDEAARGAVDEARARSLLHPKPRLEARGTVKAPPA